MTIRFLARFHAEKFSRVPWGLSWTADPSRSPRWLSIQFRFPVFVYYSRKHYRVHLDEFARGWMVTNITLRMTRLYSIWRDLCFVYDFRFAMQPHEIGAQKPVSMYDSASSPSDA